MKSILVVAIAVMVGTAALSQTIRPRKHGRTTDAKVMGERHWTVWHASQLPGLRLRKKYLVMHAHPSVWLESITEATTHRRVRRRFRRLYNRDVTNSLAQVRAFINDPRVRLRPTNHVRAEMIELGEWVDVPSGGTTVETSTTTTTAVQP